MKIEKNKVASFHYTLKDKEGNVIDSSEGREPLKYLHGAGQLIEGMEEGLEGKEKGDEFDLEIAPEKAYGNRNEELIAEIPKSEFAQFPDLQVGMQFQLSGPAGNQVVTVKEIKDDVVVIDANHPLAGETLNFHIEVTEVRDATEEEIAHGHVH
ncbi:MAG: peptidylprolyl isomerase [Candidatus Hydrogenedentota bacterium]|nr:MAG: peptidylprolyl isomerase [Candidatus Hydrogenedentota bacterium]